MNRYYRPLGYSPFYSKLNSRLFASRKARLMRGFAIAPTFQRGHQFYFRSPRGPMKDLGCWIVTLDPDGGDCAPVTPQPQPEPEPEPTGPTCPDGESVTLRWIGWWWEDFSTRPRTYHYSGGASGYDRGDIFAPDNLEIAHVDFLTEQTTLTSGSLSYPVTYRVKSGYSDWWDWLFSEVTVNATLTLPGDVSTIPNPHDALAPHGWPWEFADVPYALTRVTWGGQTVEDTAGLAPGWCDDGAAPPPDDDDDDDDAAACDPGTPIKYTCTCPDFTAEEHPHTRPRSRTLTTYRHWQNSSWPGIWAARNFPCKHIVSVAYRTRDWPLIFQWARDAARDLPARELWQQAYDSYVEYTDRTRAEREAKRDAKFQRRQRQRQESRDRQHREYLADLKAKVEANLERWRNFEDTVANGMGMAEDGFPLSWDQGHQRYKGAADYYQGLLDQAIAGALPRDPNLVVKRSMPGENATPYERYDYHFEQLGRIDDLGKFLVNEGAKYGWGANVTGNDPYSPPSHLE
jgi:hypothetical protein